MTDVLLVIHPILLVLLYLVLSLAQRFVELFDILLRVQQLTVISELIQILRHCLIELAGLSHQYLLDTEQVPVFANRLQEVVKEVIEFYSEVIPDKDDMVAQLYLVHRYTFRNLLPYQILSVSDLSQCLFDLRM